MSNSETTSTLKTTVVVGGGQIFVILAGILKTKVAALVLGPSGIGVIGLLTMALDLIKGISSLGLPISGVREISIAESSGKKESIDRSVEIFDKWVLVTSFLGSIFCIAFGFPLSKYLFGNYNYGFGIMALSVGVFFMSLTAGKLSVLQGKRAIGLMVKANLFGTITSAISTILLYLMFKEGAIIPAIIISSIINFYTVFYFYRKTGLKFRNTISLKKSFPYAKEMIKIGLFTVTVVIFDNIMGLVLRSFITKKAGVETLGYFTAATTIAGMYLTIILTSLSSDYLPKLAALKTDKQLNAAVNLQLQIVVLLAAPFIIGMVGFSDVVIRLLYSKEFIAANQVLQWQILGDFFKIIAWPCGYIFLVQGLGKFYTIYSLGYSILYVLIIYLGWNFFGFQIVGFSFFISQFIAAIFVYVFFYNKNNIIISNQNIKIILFYSIIIIFSYFVHNYFLKIYSIICNIILLFIALTFSFKNLDADVGIIKKIKSKFKRKI